MISRAGEVDRVELKIQLCPEELTEGAVASALGLRRPVAQVRQVYYFDLPDLTLYRGGFVARVRLTPSGRADLVCKLRRIRPRRLPRPVRRLPRLRVELDALPQHTLWCVSVKRRLAAEPPRADGAPPAWAELCSAEQLLFLRSLLADPLDFDDLRLFGPVSVRRLTGEVPALGRLAVEHWRLPTGQRMLELSTKCRPERAGPTAAGIRRLLAAGGVPLSTAQAAKTGMALRHLNDQGHRL